MAPVLALNLSMPPLSSITTTTCLLFLLLPTILLAAETDDTNPPSPAAASNLQNTSNIKSSMVETAFSSSVGAICAHLVIPYGYDCQEYHVETADGYILGLQRLWKRRSSNLVRGAGQNLRQPVLLQHGLLTDASSWFMNSPSENLPMILADNGYDVWMGNTRGTRSSRYHQTLSPDNPAFWHWSWDELAMYDLPANVDFIYQQTAQKIHYIGHSLGTLTALAGFSESKGVDKVQSAVLLCPVAYLSHMTSLVGNLLSRSLFSDIVSILPIAEFDPNEIPVQNLIHTLCDIPGVNCYDLLTAVTGDNCCLNQNTIDSFMQWMPQPTSVRNLIHLAQSVRDGTVAKYNYGFFYYNIRHYGRFTPPSYNLQNIPSDLPIFMAFGGRDTLSDLWDVDELIGLIRWRGPDRFKTQFVDSYSHMDFIMGVTAKDVVYANVIDFLEQHHQ